MSALIMEIKPVMEKQHDYMSKTYVSQSEVAVFFKSLLFTKFTKDIKVTSSRFNITAVQLFFNLHHHLV